MSQKKSSGSAVFVMTRCGILAAMAVILYYIEIPVVAFYKLDLSTLPAILAGFAMGPLPGVAVVVIKNLVHMLGTSTACVRDGMSGSGQERTSSPHRTACARTMRRNSSARPQPSSSRYTRAQCAAIVSGKKIRPSHVMALKNSRSHRPRSASLLGVPNSRAQTLFARRRAASRSSG